MTTQAPEQQQKILGEINLTSQVYVSLIPTIATSVIVKYDPDIQVSCVIPSREYDIIYNARGEKNKNKKKNLKINAPSLIMSCGYGDVPTPQTYKRVASGYGLYVIDESRKKSIYAKPYMLANVWDKGQICFGTTLLPGSLRQAFNYYWTSSFNSDLLRAPHVCKNQAHYYDYNHRCYCQKQKTHTCECGDEIAHNHFGCGCNTVAKSKKCRGTCGEETAGTKNKNCSCCVAINIVIKSALKVDPKLSKTKLKALIKNPGEILVKIYPGCGCGVRHKKTCPCKKGICNCPCNCICCLKKCSHLPCRCLCCKNVCNCPCNCSELQKLTQHLSNYQDTLLKSQNWINHTATFCGIKFWAAPTGAEGVLVTNNKELLLAIPREFWRKDRNGQPLIICLANKNGDRWSFESGGFSFMLRENYVITK